MIHLNRSKISKPSCIMKAVTLSLLLAMSVATLHAALYSPFGVVIGQRYRGDELPIDENDRSWFYAVSPPNRIPEFHEYRIVVSKSSKRIYGLRAEGAVYSHPDYVAALGKINTALSDAYGDARSERVGAETMKYEWRKSQMKVTLTTRLTRDRDNPYIQIFRISFELPL